MIWNFLGRGVARGCAARVGIIRCKRVEAHGALPVQSLGRSCSCPSHMNAAATFLGTTRHKEQPAAEPLAHQRECQRRRDAPSRSARARGSTIPAPIRKPRRSRNAFFSRPESRRAEARSSNCSERASHRNLSACVSSCAAAPSDRRARQPRPVARAERPHCRAHTNSGPRNNAVEKNSAMVYAAVPRRPRRNHINARGAHHPAAGRTARSTSRMATAPASAVSNHAPRTPPPLPRIAKDSALRGSARIAAGP